MSFRKPVIRLITSDVHQDSPQQGGKAVVFYSMGTLYDTAILNETTDLKYRINGGEWTKLSVNSGVVTINRNGSVEFSHKLKGKEYTRTINISGIQSGFPDSIYVAGMKPLNLFNSIYTDGVTPKPGDGYKCQALFMLKKDTTSLDTVDRVVLYNIDTRESSNVELTLFKDPTYGEVYKMPRFNNAGHFRLEITRTLNGNTLRYNRTFKVMKGQIDVSCIPNSIDGVDYESSNMIGTRVEVATPYDESITYITQNIRYTIDDGANWIYIDPDETQFYLNLTKPVTLKVEYEVADIDFATDNDIWRETESFEYRIDWMDNKVKIPSVRWIEPMEGENSLNDIIPYIVPVNGYSDKFYTESMLDGKKVEYNLTNMDNEPPYGNISMVFPTIEEAGEFYLCVERTNGVETKLFKRHISIPINLKPTIKFIELKDGETYTGNVKPKVKITPQPNNANEIDVIATISRTYNGDIESTPAILSIEGLPDDDAFIINRSGFYEIDASAYLSNGNEASDSISFIIDNDPPTIPRITGVYNGDIDFSFTIMVLKEGGVTYSISTTDKKDGKVTIHKPNIVNSGGQTFETISMTEPGDYSLRVLATKDINGLPSEAEIPQFKVLDPNEMEDGEFDPGGDTGGGDSGDGGLIQGEIITLSPANPSYSKDIHIKYNRSDINSHEFTLSNLDYSWDNMTAHIRHPNSLLRYSVPFKILEHSIGNGIFAKDYQMRPNQAVLKQESMVIGPIDHDKPPKPIIDMIINRTNVKLKIVNRSTKYRYVIKHNGKVLDSVKGANITESRDGRHKYHVICIKDSNFTMSETEVEFNVYRPVVLLAPYVAVRPITTVLPGTDIDVKIYYHPFGNKDDYRITGSNDINTLPQGVKRADFVVDKNCVITARSTPINPNTNQLDTQNYSQKYSKCCNNADYNSCGNHWSQQYGKVIDANRLWNIEFNWYPQIQKYYIGIEHRTIDNHSPILDDKPIMVKNPEIIGLDKSDGKQFSTYPHVKREFFHNYIPYLDNRPYELGMPITNEYQSQLKKHHIQVQAEVRTRNKTARSKITNEEFKIDSVHPPYPELVKDIDVLSCEPVMIDVIRENGIIYNATLNGEVFELGEYVWDDGDYILSITAYKPSNKTSRIKNFYFTINTFKVIPLEPNRMKLKPLIFENVGKAENGELIVDRGTGHLGILWNNEILSPTLVLDEKLNEYEMKLMLITKIYHDSFDQLEDLFERYKINTPNIDEMLGKWKELIIIMDLLKLEYQKLINDTNLLRTRINNDINTLKNANNRAKSLMSTSNNLLTKMNQDRLKMFNILRVLMLNTFDILRRNIMKEAELEEGMRGKMKRSDFNKWKQQQLDEYNNTRQRLQNAMKG